MNKKKSQCSSFEDILNSASSILGIRTLAQIKSAFRKAKTKADSEVKKLTSDITKQREAGNIEEAEKLQKEALGILQYIKKYEKYENINDRN